MSQQTETIKRKASPLAHFIVGGLSGVIAKSTITPLERVKILYQIKSDMYGSNSIYGSIKKIIKNEGIRGLWKGYAATVLRIFPYSAVQWFTYEYMKKNVVTDLKNPLHIFIAGSAAGSVAIIFTYPLDAIRARYASQVKNISLVSVATTSSTTTSSIITNRTNPNLFKGVWKGISPTLLGVIPYGGVGYTTYEYIKRVAPNQFRNKSTGEITGTFKLVAGGFAGGLGQTCAYPFDVVRRRIQTVGFSDSKGTVDTLKQGTFKTMYKIFKSEGIYALFKGLSINYIKVIPTNGVAFLTYDTLISFANKRF